MNCDATCTEGINIHLLLFCTQHGGNECRACVDIGEDFKATQRGRIEVASS